MTTLGRIDNKPLDSNSGIISNNNNTNSSSSYQHGNGNNNNGNGGGGGGGGGSSGRGDNRHRTYSTTSSISSSSSKASLPIHHIHHHQPPMIASGASRPYFLMFAFWFISFGYMLPWTALGSLISYYKYTYSAHFYVEIYCAYYLLGLPVALLQYKYDEWIDLKIGSQNAFLIRGVICYSLLILVQYTLLWVDQKAWMIVLFACLGFASWWQHGTSSMMVAMFPKTLIAYLQIGFRSPEIYTVIADSVLSLGKDASDEDIAIFFKINCVILLLALFNWIVTVNTGIAGRYFEEKDDRIKLNHERNLSSYARVYGDDDRLDVANRRRVQGQDGSGNDEDDDANESTSLMSQCRRSIDMDEEEWCAVKPPGSSRASSATPTPLSASVNSSVNDLAAMGPSALAVGSRTETYNALLSTASSSSMAMASEVKSSPQISSSKASGTKQKDLDADAISIGDGSGSISEKGSGKHRGFCSSCWRSVAKFSSKASYNMLHWIFVGNKGHASSEGDSVGNGDRKNSSQSSEEKIFNEVFPLCCTLMITMFCSIFQASFYAYVDSPRDWDIEQILYFTRLFCDLLGRPLTFLPRPQLFQTTNGLFTFTIIRACSMLIFFGYAFIPNCPQSDIFIIAYVALFSLASGYVSVLTYEYAAGEDLTTAERAHATNILNMCFQIAAFTAVSLSVIFTADLW